MSHKHTYIDSDKEECEVCSECGSGDKTPESKCFLTINEIKQK